MMSNADSPGAGAAGTDRDGQMSTLFFGMVMQLSQMALMLLGRLPNPETGKPVRDLDGARLFIDQLEMIEAKTLGNLNAEEKNFLKQTLLTLRMAFVEAVEHPEPVVAPPAAPPVPEATGPLPPAGSQSPPAEADKVRFTKKY